MKRKQLCVLVAALLLTSASMEIALAAPGTPQTTAFSYQGQLNAGGTFPSGQYQFTFTLYNAATGGTVVGAPVQQSLQVINGLFTTDLDFGQIFNGTQYWLDVQVGTLVTNEEELSERQPIDAVPVAQYALNSPAGTAGPTGATGPQGAMGSQGATGADGLPGNPGPQGTQGIQGPQGPVGQTGDTGTQGPQGLAGTDGAQGPTGPTGATGATGLTWQGTWNDATQYALNDGVFYAGSSYIALINNPKGQPDTSVAENDGNWGLLAMQGATGASGAPGPAGSTGPQGDQGPQGLVGAQGPQGDVGAPGPPGPQGDLGAQGPQGAQGADGGQGATGAAASGFAFSDIIPSATNAGEIGATTWMTQNGVSTAEGNAIFIAPADCASQTLRVVAQSVPAGNIYTFSVRHYTGPNNAATTGTAISSCSVFGTPVSKTCTAASTAKFAAGDGYSVRLAGNSFNTTASGIAVSLICQ